MAFWKENDMRRFGILLIKKPARKNLHGRQNVMLGGKAGGY